MAKYVEYNNLQEVKGLDQNVWNSPYGVAANGATGRHLYVNEVAQPAYYACSAGRDLDTHYIYGVERFQHPDHFSRFGYARCWNGYCSGHWPGRYIESEVCSSYDPQPPDCAPQRFYDSEHQGPYNARSQAMEDYEFWKNEGMNFLPWFPEDRKKLGL